MAGGLTLRAFEMSDAPALHQLLNEPELVGRRYLEKDRDPLSLQQVEDLLNKWTKPEGEPGWRSPATSRSWVSD